MVALPRLLPRKNNDQNWFCISFQSYVLTKQASCFNEQWFAHLKRLQTMPGLTCSICKGVLVEKSGA